MAFQINHVLFNQIKYDLAKESSSEQNKYTIIIGKNGIGKSRLLCSIINELMPLNEKNKNPKKDKESEIEASGTDKIKRIIAITASPFDKFPTVINNHYKNPFNHDIDYYYLGMKKNNSSENKSSRALLSTALERILLDNSVNNSKFQKIKSVFSILNYKAKINLVYTFKLPKKSSDIISPNANETTNIENIYNKYITRNNYNSNSNYNEDNYYNHQSAKDLYLEIIYAYKSSFTNSNIISFDIDFSQENKTISNQRYIDFFNSTRLLRMYSLMEIVDISLYREGSQSQKKSQESLSLKDASSGEQSILVTLLSIAGAIENNSLICIDEPEICLHPEWQEQFILLLIKVFSTYTGCHFLLATHSPQIISNLSEENCYILTMEDGELHDAKEYIKRSADFQLATLFDAPGFKNEYLSRELISFLAEISKTGTLPTHSLEKINQIISIKEKIHDSDPIKKLIDITEKSIELLGQLK